MKLSVIIPFYNKWELVHNRLYELHGHLSKDVDIVIVDDCSPDTDPLDPKKPGDLGGIDWWQNVGPFIGRLRYFRNKENLGFGGSMNKGAKIAIKNGAEAIVLLSNDVRVMSNFAQNVNTLLSLNPRVLIGGEVFYQHTGWNMLPGCGVVPYANGWFLATSTPTWEELGGFDPIYGRFDYEDVDLSTTAWWKEIPLVTVGAKLHHIGGQTVSTVTQSRELATRTNRERWVDKWFRHAEDLKKKIYG